ncbi:serine hydrolase [Amycolatopsis sp. YIM 10]|uniref:serine hydrolase n=1 Tax=Amycolatopsis sp. YIM 10 TaxID=2653857 RepID=UPI00128FECA7|nr:serine hydrolase [Amycolatopsis sp. YIM 10]QFU94139.1 hypothetical protein YIM_45045 [Amycolatopsis sp. YIM 10]
MKAGGSVLLVGLLAGAAIAVAVVPGATATRVVTPPAEAAAVSPAPPPPPSLVASPMPSAPPVAVDPAPSAADVTAAAPDAKLGVVVYDRESAKTLADHRGTASFTSASLVKLLIALDALESGAASSSTVERMLARSDDEIASRLWSESGGGALVTRWAKRMRLSATRPPEEDPGRWGDTTTTAADVARIYRYVLDRAPESSRTAILRGLRGATAQGSDGFAQHFGIPDAAGDIPWAVKQGWACCRPKRQLHTTGLLGEDDRYVVVVLSDHPESVGYATASKRVTEVVRTLLPLLE